MKPNEQLTLVKVVKHLLFKGNVSESLLINYNHRFHSLTELKNEDGETIEGELIDGHIDTITLMADLEYNDEEISLKSPNNLQVFYNFVNKKGHERLCLDDLIKLDKDNDSVFSLVKLNNQIFLCNFETKECFAQEMNFSTLGMIEDYLNLNFPNFILLSKTT